MDEGLRRKVLGLIFGLTVRDGELSDSEIDFLNRMYEDFEISPEKDSWVPPIGDPDHAAEELLAMPAEVRDEAVMLLVEAAAVDGVLHNAERAYLETVAKAVGWTPEQLEERMVDQLAKVGKIDRE